MANIQGQIHLCNVPISPVHQLDFSSIASQNSYFSSKKIFSSGCTNYNDRSGFLRVDGYVEDFSNVNYGYYTNTYNNVSKTFYFFIVKKELINKKTTRLTIQIDVFQTWMFDVSYGQCMIERAHVSDDSIGRHTYPESFELGEIVSFIEALHRTK